MNNPLSRRSIELDLHRVIQRLLEEKKRLDSVIASLEALTSEEARGLVLSATPAPKQRGRRWMSAEERREVSERMARYWRNRRATRDASASPPEKESRGVEVPGFPCAKLDGTSPVKRNRTS